MVWVGWGAGAVEEEAQLFGEVERFFVGGGARSWFHGWRMGWLSGCEAVAQTVTRTRRLKGLGGTGLEAPDLMHLLSSANCLVVESYMTVADLFAQNCSRRSA